MLARETLHIQSFGPIRNAEIEVRDITVFLGPQATGKSLAAQILYFMRGMEELFIPDAWGGGRIPGEGFIAKQELAGKIAGLLANWLGVGGISQRDSALVWSLRGEGRQREDRLDLHRPTLGDPERPHLSPSLATRAEAGFDSTRSGSPPIPEDQIYIPAGRVLFSFVPASLGMFLLSPRMRQDAHWPGYINVFYRKLGSALRGLHEARLQPNQGSPLDRDLQERIAKLMKGRLNFTSPDQVSLLVEDHIAAAEQGGRVFGFSPLQLASGQMEQWPFWTLVAAAVAAEQPTRIFFEEPEAHLHPSAQITLLESIAQLVRRKLRFVLTTHSPYVVYALNNFLLAQQVLDAGGALPSTASLHDTGLRRDQVSAYRFTGSGQVESILDDETGLIRTEDLDDPAAGLNDTFSALQAELLRRQEP